MTDESQNLEKTASKRSFWPGIGFLIAAGVAKAIGMTLLESAGGQRAANIAGTTDVIMAVLGLIGIILLVSTAISRSR